jgi:hypothetical protein
MSSCTDLDLVETLPVTVTEQQHLCVSSFFFVVLELELRTYTLNHSTSPLFVVGFLKIDSYKLFAWAGFEL